MTYGLVEDVERLRLLDPKDALHELDPRNIAVINDIGAAVENEQTPAPHSDPPLNTVIQAALRDTIGSNRHSKEYLRPPNSRRLLGVIKGFGIARGHSSPDNQVYTDAVVEQESGSLVVTSGGELEARAAALAFERKVRTARAGLIDTAKASTVVEDAIHSTIPRVIRAVRRQPGAEASATKIRASGMQMVGNKIVHSGRDPLLVLNTKTGETIRLSYNATPAERGIHTLDPGRYIVMMCSSTDPDFMNTNTNTLAQALLEACAEPTDPTPRHPLDTDEDKAQAKAEQIAAQVQAALGGNEHDVTVVAAAVQVDAPWHDTRSRLRRATDWGRLATFATMTAAKVIDPTLRDLHRRKIYEEMKQAGIVGKLGRAALLVLDAGFATSFALTALRFAAPELAHHLGQGMSQEISHVGHLLGWHRSEYTAATQHVYANTQTATGGTEPTGGQLGAPQVNDDMTPQQLAHATGQHPAAPAQFVETYTASAHDPNNGNGPSTISSMARQSFDFYGNEYHLSPDEIAKLKQDGLDGAINAFEHDTSNPNNVTVNDHPQRWVMDRVTYSMDGLNKQVQGAVSADAHRLGLDTTTPPPQPQAAPAAAPATPAPAPTHAPIIAAQPITPKHTGQTEKLATGGAVTAVAAGIIGAAAWLSIPKAKSWRRRRTEGVPPLPSERHEEPQEPQADSTDSRVPFYETATYDTPAQAAEELSPEHTPRHLDLATALHTPRHLDPTDPDATLLGLEQADMPVVPALGLDLRVPRSPRQPFGPDQVDERPADVDAAYRAFRRIEDPDVEVHWQHFTNQWAIIDRQRNSNLLVRLGRLLSRRGKTPAIQTNPNLSEPEDYDEELDKAEQLVAA